MTVLLCTPKILQFEYCACKFCQLVLGSQWKGEHNTMSTLNKAVVLHIISLYPNGVVRFGWEPGATDDSLVVLQTKDNS